MSTRWFFSSALVGAVSSAVDGELRTSVAFVREMGGETTEEPVSGPTLKLVGPGEVLGFHGSMVLRQEPPPDAEPAAENVLASVEFAHADLPWLLPAGVATTPSGPTPQPWMVLVVLAENEAAPPRSADPLPVLTAPVAVLPPLAERWAWAHVEARLDDGVTDIDTAKRLTEQGVRNYSPGVVGRLLCPRKLEPDRQWIAAVVPATEAGRAVGLNITPVGPGTADAWPTGNPTVDLPVYHWWTFRTGAAGTFEELARRLEFRPAGELGLGVRTIDVSQPWPAEQPTGPATVALDGALRTPGPAAPPEVWSDPAAQKKFLTLARNRLNAPAVHRSAVDPPVEDRDTVAVAPPLYGSHHTGQQTVPDLPSSWMTALNLEVRRRVVAALGARFVQLEQEFLMARAWEQVGEIREANRLLAITELATAAAEQAQHKHFDTLDVADLLVAMSPAGSRIQLPALGAGAGNAPTTLTAALDAAKSAIPPGTASSSFARLARRGGALARRAGRAASSGAVEDGDALVGASVTSGAVIEQGLRSMSMMGEDGAGLAEELRVGVNPVPLQLRRMSDRIPAESWAQRTEADSRPLRPIMAHPAFGVAMAEEILARWPEWAIPGIGAIPPNSVTLLETNPEFVAALMVGLNHEFNRELLWREFPTDQRGTCFARFWPTEGVDIDEIARWPLDAPLGSQLRFGNEGTLALLVRGDLLRRFPGTALHAVRGEDGKLPAASVGLDATPLALDESTVLYLLSGISEERAVAEDWFFVFREPMRGTQFGFDSGPQPGRMTTWADLTWNGLTVTAGCVRLQPAPGTPTPGTLGTDPPVWGRDAADMARIAFQQPFQLAFRATTLLRA